MASNLLVTAMASNLEASHYVQMDDCPKSFLVCGLEEVLSKSERALTALCIEVNLGEQLSDYPSCLVPGKYTVVIC